MLEALKYSEWCTGASQKKAVTLWQPSTLIAWNSVSANIRHGLDKDVTEPSICGARGHLGPQGIKLGLMKVLGLWGMKGSLLTLYGGDKVPKNTGVNINFLCLPMRCLWGQVCFEPAGARVCVCVCKCPSSASKQAAEQCLIPLPPSSVISFSYPELNVGNVDGVAAVISVRNIPA